MEDARRSRNQRVDRRGERTAPLYGDEPARTHWADILALAERLAPTPALIPEPFAARVLAFGLCNEIMGQDGLVWNMRLSMIELSLQTQGARGYAMSIAQYLGARYGYSAGCGAAAQARVAQILEALEAQLQRGGPYYFGAAPCALDIYSAAAMDTLSPLPPEQCPMHPKTRAALEARRDAAPDPLPAGLLAHRDLMHQLHIPLPMEC